MAPFMINISSNILRQMVFRWIDRKKECIIYKELIIIRLKYGDKLINDLI